LLLPFTWLGNDRWPFFADAMQLFAQSQDKWSETWPESDDRAMRMYVFAFSKFVNRADVRGWLLVIT